jgi:hypothetical protein
VLFGDNVAIPPLSVKYDLNCALSGNPDFDVSVGSLGIGSRNGRSRPQEGGR